MNAFDSRGRSQARAQRDEQKGLLEGASAEMRASVMEEVPVSASGPRERALGFELSVAASALAVLGALWLLSLALGPALAAGGAVAATSLDAMRTLLHVRGTGRALNWQIRDEDDLARARGAAEADMKAAAILMARIMGVLVFCLASDTLLCGLALICVLVPFGPWASSVEGRFRAMDIEDPGLKSRFNRIVRAWKEPRWKLPEDV